MPVTETYRASRAFLSLGPGFADAVAPARFPEHRLRYRNQRAARAVGLEALTAPEWESHFASFSPLPEGQPEALAARYHGHQFGVYNPQLGDGRGFLFAQLRDARDGRLLDLGTKGSGRTPYSRTADGRLTLKGGVREVLATERLEALGVDTSKSFSLFETGEKLLRHDEPSPTRSSVLVRLSHSHVRFGTFQYHRWHGDRARLGQLLDYCAEHLLPELAEGSPAEPLAARFLQRVVERTAVTAAGWMAAGFVHGVLNTDNMNVTGESFDYGPWRFLPHYDQRFVAAYFDETGLYAFGQQPSRLQWNLVELARTLSELCPAGPLERALGTYAGCFERALRRSFCSRLGVEPRGWDEDGALLGALFSFLEQSRVGWDRFFFDWYGGLAREPYARSSPAREHYESARFAPLRAALEGYATAPGARTSHAYFQDTGPCSLTIDEVEALWEPIATRDDWSLFEQKIADTQRMGEALGGASAEPPRT